MVKRQEEKRRKRFANRVWACRFPLEERQAWSGEQQPCRSFGGERQHHARVAPTATSAVLPLLHVGSSKVEMPLPRMGSGQKC
jgi:hypothetical protein